MIKTKPAKLIISQEQENSYGEIKIIKYVEDLHFWLLNVLNAPIHVTRAQANNDKGVRCAFTRARAHFTPGYFYPASEIIINVIMITAHLPRILEQAVCTFNIQKTKGFKNPN